jgi:hypothetical protein
VNFADRHLQVLDEVDGLCEATAESWVRIEAFSSKVHAPYIY